MTLSLTVQSTALTLETSVVGLEIAFPGPQGATGATGSITVQEQDGTPTVNNVTEIRVPNGQLTDESGGAVSIDAAPTSHNHSADDITSDELAHERGGLEFNASGVTTGDLIRGASAGTMSLLNVGTDGQVLTAQADGSVAWEDASGSGEANTASNVGTAGVGVFKQKASEDLEFKKINAGSSKVTITDDTGNDEVDIDVVEANINHNSLLNYTVATHRVINDGGTSTTELWSASKISTEIAAVGGGTAELATGTYTGDGNATQAITGVGFQAEFIFVWPAVDGQSPTGPGHKSVDDGTKTRSGFAYNDDHVISLDADGFTVGDGTGTSNLYNVSARVYNYVVGVA